MAGIAIIGPKAAGKTTYLAALAHLSQSNIFPSLNIHIVSDENNQALKNMASNLIEMKDVVGQTEPSNGNEPTYSFTIDIPAGKYVSKQTLIKLSFIDYAGEIFDKIAKRPNEVQLYINQLLRTEAWLVMLTDFRPQEADREYQPILKSLWERLASKEQMITKRHGRKLRMAIVMSKCERGEIWTGRLDPDEDLFKVRLPNTYKYLIEDQKISSERLRFFACSSFGVRGHQDPRPNRESFSENFSSEFSATIRKDCKWQPYGLIAPLYWLETGKVLSEPSI